MNYVITIRKTGEIIENIDLGYRTEVGTKISIKDKTYLVKEIVILNPDEGIIELKCWDVSNSGKQAKLTTVIRNRI